MAYSYDFTSDNATRRSVGQVRLLIPDNRLQLDGEGEPLAQQPEVVFTDEEIGVFLDLEGGNIYRATAQALDNIAADMTILYKHIEVMDVVVDAVSAGKALMKRAETLRKQAAAKQEFYVLGFDDIDRTTSAAT